MESFPGVISGVIARPLAREGEPELRQENMPDMHPYMYPYTPTMYMHPYPPCYRVHRVPLPAPPALTRTTGMHVDVPKWPWGSLSEKPGMESP